MITRVIFLVSVTFNDRDYNRFGIEILGANGFRVEVWDLTRCLNPSYEQQSSIRPLHRFDGLRTFKSTGEIVASVKALGADDLIVSVLGYTWTYLPIYRAIARRGIRHGLVLTNSLPTPAFKSNYLKICLKALRNPSKAIDFVVNRYPYTLAGIPEPSFALAGGSESVKGKHATARTRVIWAHTLDYDLYLAARNRREKPGNHRSAVFLDEYLPFHPDHDLRKVPPPSMPEKYFPALVKFFERIEKQLSAEVIIAAHPRSCYENQPEYFGGRQVCRDQTAELVRDADVVIAHSSTSLNFAVLYEKPVVFVTSDDLKNTYMEPFISTMAAWFGKRPINIDREADYDVRKELAVDRAKYAHYKECYIKKAGSPELPAWQIFSDALKRI